MYNWETNNQFWGRLIPWGFLPFGLILLLFSGCAVLQDRYIEKHKIQNLTVIFLDQDTLEIEWKRIADSDPTLLKVQLNSTVPLVHTVRGFYDLYCLPLKIAGADGAPARAILIQS